VIVVPEQARINASSNSVPTRVMASEDEHY
jgi:hypothetical protein